MLRHAHSLHTVELFCSIRLMDMIGPRFCDEKIECFLQWSNIKFCQKLGKSVMETPQLLHMVFDSCETS